MSKFLKFIVSLMLIVFILAGVGLIVPQFLGIDVVVVQETNAGNQKVGTAIYTQKKDVAVLAPGEKILDLGTNTLNVFTVVSYDPASGVVNVTGGDLDSLLVSRTWLKVLTAVPFIGFLSIATQSTNGLIILGVLLGLVILLFIFSEILRRGDDYDDYDDDDDDFYRELVEKKRSADREDAARRKKKPRKDRRKGKKSSCDDEIEETESREDRGFGTEEDADAPDITRVIDQIPAEPVQEDGMTEIRREEEDPGTGENAEQTEPDVQKRDFGTDSLPDVQAALEAALENQPLNRSEDTHIPENEEPEPYSEEPEMASEIELAMPVYTAEELLQQAYNAGRDPKVIEEPVTGVKLVDFSESL